MESKSVEPAPSFLARLDANDRVSKEHYAIAAGIMPKKRLRRRRCCFTVMWETDPASLPPNQEFISSFSFQVWFPVMIGLFHMVMQLFRPLLLVVSLAVPLLYNLYSSNSSIGAVNPSSSAFSSGLALCNAVGAVCFLLILYSFKDDLMFQRAWCNKKTKVTEGLYYSSSSPTTSRIVQRCPRINGERPYVCTPWLVNGDLRTMLPFMLFTFENVQYNRRFVKLDDGEAVAVDIAFPPSKATIAKHAAAVAAGEEDAEGEAEGKASEGIFDVSKPIIVVLHGLNGGSSEPYVLDLVRRGLAQGHTVAVMVARGLMNTPLVYNKCFSGARISDVHTVIEVVKAAGGPDARVALVGFSMGGLIAANHAVRMGADAGVIGTVAYSASADVFYNNDFSQSKQVWQPFLSFELKKNLIIPSQELLSWPGPAKHKIDVRKLEASRDISEFDAQFLTRMGGYSSLQGYYEDVSCGAHGKLKKLTTPLLMVHAEDDPILGVDALDIAVEEAKSGNNDHLVVAITEHGGHVGWPSGMNPKTERWSWMSLSALEFINACDAVLREGLTNGNGSRNRSSSGSNDSGDCSTSETSGSSFGTEDESVLTARGAHKAGSSSKSRSNSKSKTR